MNINICVCVCVLNIKNNCAYIFIYVYTHTRTQIHTYIYIHIHTYYIQSRPNHICAYMYMFVCVCVCKLFSTMVPFPPLFQRIRLARLYLNPWHPDHSMLESSALTTELSCMPICKYFIGPKQKIKKNCNGSQLVSIL